MLRADFLDAALADPASQILVHCMAGVSRSATIVAAHLMRAERLRVKEALAAVQAGRPFISPNPGFRRQLQYFEVSLQPSGGAGGLPT